MLFRCICLPKSDPKIRKDQGITVGHGANIGHSVFMMYYLGPDMDSDRGVLFLEYDNFCPLGSLRNASKAPGNEIKY